MPSAWATAPWTKTTLSTSPLRSHESVGTHDRVGQARADEAGVVIEHRNLGRVLAVRLALVEEEEQGVADEDRRRSRADAERAFRGLDDRVPVEIAEMLVPVARRRIPEIVERVEHRELHVRVDAVDHRDPAVAQVEEDGILVRDPFRADDATRGAVEEEPAVVEPEPMNADPPGSARLGRRQVRVGHHDSLVAAAPDELHPRILVDVIVGRTLCEHLLERRTSGRRPR